MTAGYKPAEILVEHYGRMARSRITASERVLFKQAKHEVALLGSGFIQEISDAIGVGVAGVVDFFRDSRVVKFFSKIGWSFKSLLEMLKDGLKAVKDLAIALKEFAEQSEAGKFLKRQLDAPTLRAIDEWLKQHPKTRRMSGYVLGAAVLYMWFVAPFVGNPNFDFDMSEVFDALAGNYSLTDMFSGASGAALLLSFLAGVGLSLSFPWPGTVSIHFIGSVMFTLAKKLNKRFKESHGATASEEESGWIGVDFDGTLARYDGDPQSLGEPLLPMLCLVKLMLDAGIDVRIFTARVASVNEDREEQRAAIQEWTMKYLGVKLPVTAEKDQHMKNLYDDRATRVIFNTGIVFG